MTNGPTGEHAPQEIAAKYRLVAPRYTGVTSVLWEGSDPRDEGPVLVKVLRDGAVASATERQRIKREIGKLSQLRHEVLVPCLEGGEAEGRLWLARPFIPGESLAERLARTGPFPPGEVARIGARIASVLGEIHRNGLLHRDLRPGHVLIDPSGIVRLVDVGMGRTFRSADGRHAVGTPGYVSPEAITGKLVSFRSDLYSLGALLYELLTGAAPFGTPDSPGVLTAQCEREVPAITVPAPTAPSKLLVSLLAREPRERPFSAQQLERHLEPLAAADEPDEEDQQEVRTVVGPAPTRDSAPDPFDLRTAPDAGFVESRPASERAGVGERTMADAPAAAPVSRLPSVGTPGARPSRPPPALPHGARPSRPPPAGPPGGARLQVPPSPAMYSSSAAQSVASPRLPRVPSIPPPPAMGLAGTMMGQGLLGPPPAAPGRALAPAPVPSSPHRAPTPAPVPSSPYRAPTPAPVPSNAGRAAPVPWGSPPVPQGLQSLVASHFSPAPQAAPAAGSRDPSEAAEISGNVALPGCDAGDLDFEDVTDTVVNENSRIFGVPGLNANPYGTAVPPLPSEVAQQVLTGIAIVAPSVGAPPPAGPAPAAAWPGGGQFLPGRKPTLLGVSAGPAPQAPPRFEQPLPQVLQVPDLAAAEGEVTEGATEPEWPSGLMEMQRAMERDTAAIYGPSAWSPEAANSPPMAPQPYAPSAWPTVPPTAAMPMVVPGSQSSPFLQPTPQPHLRPPSHGTLAPAHPGQARGGTGSVRVGERRPLWPWAVGTLLLVVVSGSAGYYFASRRITPGTESVPEPTLTVVTAPAPVPVFPQARMVPPVPSVPPPTPAVAVPMPNVPVPAPPVVAPPVVAPPVVAPPVVAPQPVVVPLPAPPAAHPQPAPTPAPAPAVTHPQPAPVVRTPAPTPRPSTTAPAPRPSTTAPAPRPSTTATAPRPSTTATAPRPSTTAPTGPAPTGPDNPRIRDAIRRHDWSAARSLLAAAVRAQPRSAPLHAQLGEMNERLGERPAALTEYRSALRLDPRNTRTMFRLADLQESMGNRTAAIATLRQILAISPHDPAATRRLETLRSAPATPAATPPRPTPRSTARPAPRINSQDGVIPFGSPRRR